MSAMARHNNRYSATPLADAELATSGVIVDVVNNDFTDPSRLILPLNPDPKPTILDSHVKNCGRTARALLFVLPLHERARNKGSNALNPFSFSLKSGQILRPESQFTSCY